MKNLLTSTRFYAFSIKITVSAAVVTLSTFLTAQPSRADDFRIGFSNGCHTSTISVAVSWREPNSNEWVDEGWWEFSPGERSLLSGVLTGNRIFYYYAESDDSRVWGSDDQPALVINGRQYIPRRVQGDFSDGRHYVNLTCTGETPIETTPEVIGERHVDIGGGWGGAKVTLYRNGLLIIEGRAVSNANTSATRATVNVVGVDRNGNALFVSRHLDIPTACGRLDPGCPSDRTGSSEQNISPEIARFVNRLNIHVSDRGGPGFFERTVRAINEACSSYDDLPQRARDAIAAEAGFSGCN